MLGGWNETTIGAAYALNDPLLVYEFVNAVSTEQPSSSGQSESLIISQQPHIVIETIKQAEDGKGLIARFYESQRYRGPVTLRTAFPLKEVWYTNLLEQNQQEVIVNGCEFTLEVRPYEIVTLRLLPST